MSYDLQAHRCGTREQLVHLLRDGGPGWFPYVLAEAERLVKDDPVLHDGLVAAVEEEIGPKALPAARAAFSAKGNSRARR